MDRTIAFSALRSKLVSEFSDHGRIDVDQLELCLGSDKVIYLLAALSYVWESAYETGWAAGFSHINDDDRCSPYYEEFKSRVVQTLKGDKNDP